MFSETLEKIKDLFFPPHCSGCGRIGSFLCERCNEKIIRIKDQHCPFCNTLSAKGKTCPRCRSKVALTGAISFGYLKDPVLCSAIYEYKYERIKDLVDTLSGFLVLAIKENGIKFDSVAFVPISRKREAWRGFNQAELLAQKVASELGVEMIKLTKTKETKTQVGLKRKERIRNLSGAFNLAQGDVSEKRVLIIDDVETTGTTLNECAIVLRKNGAHEVWGAVIAKE